MGLLNYSLWNQLKHIKLDKSGGNTGADTDYSTFEADGTYVANGDATTFEDVFLPLTYAKVPAASAPTWTPFSTNLNSYTFDVGDYVDLGTVEFLHRYKEDSDFEFHTHIITNGTDTVDKHVKYRLYYSLGILGGTMSEEAYAEANLIIPAGTSDRTHIYFLI